jgi:hypothetical protein
MGSLPWEIDGLGNDCIKKASAALWQFSALARTLQVVAVQFVASSCETEFSSVARPEQRRAWWTAKTTPFAAQRVSPNRLPLHLLHHSNPQEFQPLLNRSGRKVAQQ